MCRICMQLLKRNPVICSECGLICHSTCAQLFPQACHQRSVLTTSFGRQNSSSTFTNSRNGGNMVVRPVLSRDSMSTPVVALTPESSEYCDLSQRRGSDRAEFDRRRAFEKLTGVPQSKVITLTEFPTNRFLPARLDRRHVSAPPNGTMDKGGLQYDDATPGDVGAMRQSSDCAVM
jgi:hypothetical protein